MNAFIVKFTKMLEIKLMMLCTVIFRTFIGTVMQINKLMQHVASVT